MDFLRSALNEKKKELELSKKKISGGAKRKRGIEEEKNEKKFATRGELAAVKKEKAKKERAEEESVELKKEPSATATVPESRGDSEVGLDDGAISPVEVKLRLRTYGQPITLFGESDADRFERLKQFEIHQHEKMTGSSDGRTNIFQEIMNQEVESEIMKASVDALTPEERKQKEKATLREKRRVSKYTKQKKKTDFKCVEDYVLFFFKKILQEWELELAARPPEEASSTKGKVASATHKQTRKYIRPLFKLLKARKTSADILKQVEKIIDCCLSREYIKANEAYLLMAIGNAAWPMGVTMVGIHERAGREKIFSQQVAHVLNDETQRKYIQSIKRLMSHCQKLYPNGTKI